MKLRQRDKNYRNLLLILTSVFIVSLVACLVFEGNIKERIPRQNYYSYAIRPKPQPKVAVIYTSPLFSKYHVINRKETYHINDSISVLIEAWGSNGLPQRTGGAYFRAKIMSEDLKAASRSDGEIVDFGNGTYLAQFILRWPGEVKVMVMLVDTSGAVRVLNRIRDEFPNRGTYTGHFKKGEIRELKTCNVDHVALAGEEECDLTDPETGITWYCVRPTDPHLQCKHWWKHTSNNSYIFEQQYTYIRPWEERYFIAHKEYLDCENCTVKVVDTHKKTGKVDKYDRLPWQQSWSSLPKCLPGIINKYDSVTSGYLYKDKWYSTHCRNLQFDAKKAAKCLAKKTVLILADSTGKQLSTYLTALLNLEVLPSDDCMSHGRDNSTGFNIYYKFHGLPSRGMHGGSAHCFRHSVPHVLDHITFIPDVFILSITAHFTIHTMDLLKKRLQIIKAAVERLHTRSPKTLFIIKSSSTREYQNLSHILSNNEWYMYTLDRLVREMFSSYPHVALIDVWDMSVAQFVPDSIHPKRETLANIVDLTLSYICPT